MKNKLTAFLSLVLFFSVVGTTIAYANTTNFSTMVGAEQSFGSEPIDYWEIRDEAEETRAMVYNLTAESTQRSLQTATVSYNRTMNNSLSDYVDVYVDDLGNEYVYDMDGSVIGMYVVNNSNVGIYSSGNNVSVNTHSSQTFEEKAHRFLSSVYGDWFDKYQLLSIEYKHDTKKYCIKYAVKIGEYITNEVCTVNVDENGSICNYGIANKDTFEAVTEADVAGYEESELVSYAIDCVEVLYPNNMVSSDVTKITLVKLNGQFYFQMNVSVVVGSALENDIIAQVVYYAID